MTALLGKDMGIVVGTLEQVPNQPLYFAVGFVSWYIFFKFALIPGNGCQQWTNQTCWQQQSTKDISYFLQEDWTNEERVEDEIIAWTEYKFIELYKTNITEPNYLALFPMTKVNASLSELMQPSLWNHTQEASRFRTRCESAESIANRHRSMQVRYLSWLWTHLFWTFGDVWPVSVTPQQG